MRSFVSTRRTHLETAYRVLRGSRPLLIQVDTCTPWKRILLVSAPFAVAGTVLSSRRRLLPPACNRACRLLPSHFTND